MVRFEVLTAVLIKFEAIWYMMQSRLVPFGGFNCLHHQGLCSLSLSQHHSHSFQTSYTFHYFQFIPDLKILIVQKFYSLLESKFGL